MKNKPRAHPQIARNVIVILSQRESEGNLFFLLTSVS